MGTMISGIQTSELPPQPKSTEEYITECKNLVSEIASPTKKFNRYCQLLREKIELCHREQVRCEQRATELNSTFERTDQEYQDALKAFDKVYGRGNQSKEEAVLDRNRDTTLAWNKARNMWGRWGQAVHFWEVTARRLEIVLENELADE